MRGFRGRSIFEQMAADTVPSSSRFDETNLFIVGRNGTKTEYTFVLVHDAHGDALRIERPPETGWINYQLDGDRLKVAFYDNLQGRPDGFE